MVHLININATVWGGGLAGHPRVAHMAIPGLYVDTRDLNSGSLSFEASAPAHRDIYPQTAAVDFKEKNGHFFLCEIGIFRLLWWSSLPGLYVGSLYCTYIIRLFVFPSKYHRVQ